VVAAEVLVGSSVTGVGAVEAGSVDTGVPVAGTVEAGSVEVGSVDTGVPVVGSVVVGSVEVVVVVVGSVEVDVVVPVVVVPPPAPVAPGVEVEEVPAGYPVCGAWKTASLPLCCSDRIVGWLPARAVVVLAPEGPSADGADALERTGVTEATVIGPAVVVVGREGTGTAALAAARRRPPWWCGVAETCWIPIALPAATTVAAMIAAT
jgi:hypothetical protein